MNLEMIEIIGAVITVGIAIIGGLGSLHWWMIARVESRWVQRVKDIDERNTAEQNRISSNLENLRHNVPPPEVRVKLSEVDRRLAALEADAKSCIEAVLRVEALEKRIEKRLDAK